MSSTIQNNPVQVVDIAKESRFKKLEIQKVLERRGGCCDGLNLDYKSTLSGAPAAALIGMNECFFAELGFESSLQKSRLLQLICEVLGVFLIFLGHHRCLCRQKWLGKKVLCA